MTLIHDRNPLFVQLSNGDFRNGYDLKILNKTHEDHSYALTVRGLEDAKVTMAGAGILEAGSISVAADSVGQYKVFVEAPVPAQAPIDIEFQLSELSSNTVITEESVFMTKRPHE